MIYCCRPEHLIFHRHLLRSNISLDLANLLQVGFDLRNTLERKISPSKIKASDRRQYNFWAARFCALSSSAEPAANLRKLARESNGAEVQKIPIKKLKTYPRTV